MRFLNKTGLFFQTILLYSVLFFSLVLHAAPLFSPQQPQFLDADDAFVFTTNLDANNITENNNINEKNRDKKTTDKNISNIELNWRIADGYYLYKKSIDIVVHNGEIGEIVYPQAERHQDEFFGEVDIYRHNLQLIIPLINASSSATLVLTYQGCTQGLCYAPQEKIIHLPPTHDAVQTENSNLEQPPQSWRNFNQDDLAEGLANNQYSLFLFFLLGISLAFTPCVLPMLPLISTIVIGQQQRPNTLRALGISIVYIQGMALCYALLGLIVVAIGLPFQIALQSPYVLITFSALFIILALSMFGLFEIKLPAYLQQKWIQLQQRQQSGTYKGAFIMGAISGIILSPCTSAPLYGTLLFVAQSGDFFTGALTLYILAIGMGIPLLAIALLGNKILPKSGNWLTKIKVGLGFIMLAVPILLISRLLPEIWELRLWSLLLVSFLIWLTWQISTTIWGTMIRIILSIIAVIAAKPLQEWFWDSLSHQQVNNITFSNQLNFQQVNNFLELENILQDNSQSLVVLDVYADWCVACKEFEKYTFSDPAVQEALDDVLLLRIDVSKNNKENSELLKKLGLLGLPALIFYDQDGKEINKSRITGFLASKPFLSKINILLKINDKTWY